MMVDTKKVSTINFFVKIKRKGVKKWDEEKVVKRETTVRKKNYI